MNPIAVFAGGYTVYWSAVVIAFGMAAALSLTLGLHPRYERRNTAVWVMFPFAVFFSVLFSRFLHWYCHIEYYPSFLAAMSDYSRGSFVLPGVLMGTWLAGRLVSGLRLTRSTGRLLDAAAPGMALCIAFIRLSALFNNSCRGRMTITNGSFQSLPFASPLMDAAGNTSYHFATFFVEFLLMLLVTGILTAYYFRYRKRPMKGGFSNDGNAARMFLLLYGGVEIIMDSTRYDSHLMHFTFLKMLNPYASFISVAQVFAAASILCVFLRFLVISLRTNGFRWYHVPSVLLFLAFLFGIGYLGEYKVQRTGRFLVCYLWQGSSILLMILVVCLIFASCKKREST